MHKKHSKIKLRAALLSLVTIALLAATAVFMGTSAAEAVSDSDLVASSSDADAPEIVALADEDIGELQIVMTTSKAVGETLSLMMFDEDDFVYVDFGDGIPVPVTIVSSNISGEIKGQTIRIYNNSFYNNDFTIEFSCAGQEITSLRFYNNINLGGLLCNNNKLTELDVSKFSDGFDMDCSYNNLSKITYADNRENYYVLCNNNALKFSTLVLDSNNFLAYDDQQDIVISDKILSGENIDLSSEYNIQNTKSIYTWYDSDDNEVTPTKSENGVFTFGDEFVGKTLYCTMTNALYPDLILKTTSVTIEPGLGEPKVTMTTGKAVGETLKFELNISEAYVDWGDGNIVKCSGTTSYGEYVYSNALAGNTVKVYSTADITKLDCSACSLTALDVSKNTALTELWCENNNLTALDVSNNTALVILSCFNNNLTTLDVTKNTALTGLDCSHNKLKFSTLKVNSPQPAYFYYSPQAEVEIASSIKADQTIDLSSEYEVYGKNTVYKWYEVTESSTSELTVSADNEVTPTNSENGVFTFGDEFVGKTLYCTMTNEAFPDLTLKTTSVKVEAKEAYDTPDNPNQGDNDDTSDDTTNTGKGPSTGESIALTVVASCLAVLSLAAIGAVLYKKKFAAPAK